MAHIKVVPAGSWDWGEPVTQLIKVAHDGLRGHDFKALVKRAGYGFADQMRRFPLKPGDVPIHNLALGATEFYGPNRNGDGFKEATSRKCHDSFVKFARWYRHHKNKDASKSYGLVKASCYNDVMNRIELLVFLNGTKEAADRNGGLLADTELNMLEAGKDLPTSMACKVAYDVCAACGNKARHKGEYCMGEEEGGHCKRGGCKNNLTLLHDDGFITHVENPDAAFFDMSLVFRGADRTSWGFGGVKAASSGLLPGGAELAEKLGLTTVPSLSGSLAWPTEVEKLATALAVIEDDFSSSFEKQAAYDAAFAGLEDVTWNDHGVEPLRALGALTLLKVAMPIEGFVALFDRKCEPATVKLAQRHLPGIFGRLIEAGQITEENLKPYTPVGMVVPPTLYKWASERAEGYSLEDRFLDRRVQLAAMYGSSAPAVNQPLQVKVAGGAESLARDYSFYKLAFLRALAGRGENTDLTRKLVVRQNYLQ